jgi:hypothetical protein
MEPILLFIARLFEGGLEAGFLTVLKVLGFVSLIDWLQIDHHWMYAVGAIAVVVVGLANVKK